MNKAERKIFDHLMTTDLAKPQERRVQFIPESLDVRNLATYFAGAHGVKEATDRMADAFFAAAMYAIAHGLDAESIHLATADYASGVSKGALVFEGTREEDSIEIEIRVANAAYRQHEDNRLKKREQMRKVKALEEAKADVERLSKELEK